MFKNVLLEYLGHQCVHGSACGGNALKDVAASVFVFQSPFDAFDLAANPANAVEEFGLVANSVTHLRGILQM